MRLHDRVVFKVLEELRTQIAPRTAHEIASAVAIKTRQERSIPISGGLNSTVNDILTKLEHFGITQSSTDDEKRKSWALAIGARTSNEQEGGNDGRGSSGGDGSSGGGNGRDGGENEGGRGLSEVLQHPVLFSLEESDQETAVNAALGLKRTSEGWVSAEDM